MSRFNEAIYAGRFDGRYIVTLNQTVYLTTGNIGWTVHAYDVRTGKSIMPAYVELRECRDSDDIFFKFTDCWDKYTELCDFLGLGITPQAKDSFFIATA